jgi:hypothetical protein
LDIIKININNYKYENGNDEYNNNDIENIIFLNLYFIFIKLSKEKIL